MKPAKYRFDLDGKESEEVGFTCLVDIAGKFGASGFKTFTDNGVSDGFLDMVLIRERCF